MNKATFQARGIITFQDECDMKYNEAWETYKKQPTSSVGYTRSCKVVQCSGFKLGLWAIVPLVIAVIIVF